MKIKILLPFFLLLLSCAPQPSGIIWESFPIPIAVEQEEILLEATTGAMKAINEALGDIVSYDENKYKIYIKCNKGELNSQGAEIGRYYNSWEDYIIKEAMIIIDCKHPKKQHIIIHEIYHSLGFPEHSKNKECLSYHNITKENQFICEEMINDFNNLYF